VGLADTVDGKVGVEDSRSPSGVRVTRGKPRSMAGVDSDWLEGVVVEYVEVGRKGPPERAQAVTSKHTRTRINVKGRRMMPGRWASLLLASEYFIFMNDISVRPNGLS
jgi:hypothetical protein